MSVVRKRHGSSYPGVFERGEVHVEHGSQRGEAVSVDEPVGRVADQAGRELDPSEVDDGGRHYARRLVNGLTIHLTLGGQGVHGGRLLSAEHRHLLVPLRGRGLRGGCAVLFAPRGVDRRPHRHHHIFRSLSAPDSQSGRTAVHKTAGKQRASNPEEGARGAHL